MYLVTLKKNNIPTEPGFYLRQDLDGITHNINLVDIRIENGELLLVGAGVGCYRMTREKKENKNVVWSDKILIVDEKHY